MTATTPSDEPIDLDAVRDRLESMHASVSARKEALSRHLDHREEPLPADFSEQAVELENDEARVAIKNELDTEFRNLAAALKRLEEGNYERCERCAADISRARLEAIPETALCLDCATAAEDVA